MGTEEVKKILDKMGMAEVSLTEEFSLEDLSEFRDKVIQDAKAQIKEAILKVL